MSDSTKSNTQSRRGGGGGGDELSENLGRMNLDDRNNSGGEIGARSRRAQASDNSGASSTSSRRDKSSETINYDAQRMVGHGSFGAVFQAKVVETGEVVAIKKSSSRSKI